MNPQICFKNEAQIKSTVQLLKINLNIEMYYLEL